MRQLQAPTFMPGVDIMILQIQCCKCNHLIANVTFVIQITERKYRPNKCMHVSSNSSHGFASIRRLARAIGRVYFIQYKLVAMVGGG